MNHDLAKRLLELAETGLEGLEYVKEQNGKSNFEQAMYDDILPIIGLNDKDRYPAKTFSIVHELAHLMKRQSVLCNETFTTFSSSEEEVFCNAVAGEVLVPTASLEDYLDITITEEITLDHVDKIAKRFSLSKEVIVRRLFDINRLSRAEYNAFSDEIYRMLVREREMEKAARKDGRGQVFFRNMSRQAIDRTSPILGRILFIGCDDGHFTKYDVSGILGIKVKHVPKFLAEVANW